MANLLANLGCGVGRWWPYATLTTMASAAVTALHSDARALPTPQQYAAREQQAGCATAAVFTVLACSAAVAKCRLDQQVPTLAALFSRLEDVVSQGGALEGQGFAPAPALHRTAMMWRCCFL